MPESTQPARSAWAGQGLRGQMAVLSAGVAMLAGLCSCVALLAVAGASANLPLDAVLAAALATAAAAGVAATLAWHQMAPLARLQMSVCGPTFCFAGLDLDPADLPADVATITRSVRKLLRSQDRHRHELQAVLDHANVGLALTRDGLLAVVNRQLCVDLGYQREQLVGQSPRLAHPSDEEFDTFSRQALPQLAEHGLLDVEAPLMRRDGSRYWARLMGRAVLPGDQSAGFIWVISDVTRERDQRDQLQWAATHDRLTRLLNRAAFEACLDEACRHAAQVPFCLLFIDLDRFKLVNDHGGHAAGDALLRDLSTELAGCLRASDTLARLGGDEFAVLLRECTVPQAREVAERLCRSVESYRLLWAGRSFGVGASVGMVLANGLHAGAEDLLRRADAACYQAKHGGRNQVVLGAAVPMA